MANRRLRPRVAVEDRRFGPMLPAVVLTGVVLIAVIAAGWLGTSPAEETTSTVPSLADAPAEPLEWEPGNLEVAAWPIGFVELDDRYLLYGETGAEEPVVEAWVSEDGLAWKHLGAVLAPSELMRPARSTAQGLLGVGTKGSGPWESPALWISPDGVAWREIALPDELLTGAYELNTATATEDRLVVFGSERYDWLENLAARTLVERGLAAPAAFESMWIYLTEDGGRCVGILEGPLGTSTSFDADQLGLSEEETELCRSADGGWWPDDPKTYAWTTENETDWRRVEISSSWIEDAFVDDDGTIVALTYDGSTSVVLRSVDGYHWSRQVLPFGNYNVRLWEPVGIVAVRDGFPTPKLTRSRDGETWDEYTIPALVLSRDYGWHLDGPVTGAAGALVVAVGEGEGRMLEPAEPDPLERDGYRLVVTPGWGISWILERDGETVLETTEPPSGLSIDPVALNVIFSDPATGETLTHFTFDEIDRAIEAAWPRSSSQTSTKILFSSDGVEWSVQDVTEMIGANVFVEMAHIGDDRVLLLTTEDAEVEPPTARVWVALVGEADAR